MKFAGLLLLGLLSFAATLAWKFPAAGVLPHVNTDPLLISGVEGTLWRGSAQHLSDPSQPAFALSNVGWRLLPSKLVNGQAAVALDFEVLDGYGQASVARTLAGNVLISDAELNVRAETLQQFMPLPIADFVGTVLADVESAEIENNFLKSTTGTLIWRNAEVTGALRARLGQVVLDIIPEREGDSLLHRGKLSNSDGDPEVAGEFELDQSGNYRADLRLTPLPQTPDDLSGMLGLIGQQSSDGSYRIRNNGNIMELL